MRESINWRAQGFDEANIGESSLEQVWVPDFAELVEQHQSMVFSLAWRITGDSGLAEELAQDVFLELDRNLHKIKSADHVRFWLRQVTLHRSADALRRKRAKGASLNSDLWVELEERHGLVESEEGNSLSVRIEELLATLPESQRAALVLRYQEDLTPDEIAVMIKAPVATVKSHLQRGLRLLRARIQQRYGAKESGIQKSGIQESGTKRTLKEYVRGI